MVLVGITEMDSPGDTISGVINAWRRPFCKAVYPIKILLYRRILVRNKAASWPNSLVLDWSTDDEKIEVYNPGRVYY
uniref:Uncharacterized protein n=1 Tax=Timema bartmani TaxID=61472 RepID=A0A7R9I1T7_9NEOP|nr:unnamed protein product [Timema bartmani]